MHVPWSKLYIDEDELNNIIAVVKSGWMASGPKVEEFEKRMADYVGVKHAIAVNSGTAALDVALKALGIKQGDQVIIPGLTYIATAHAVCYQGAIPVFADIDPTTYTIDPQDIRRKITPKTKCIIPVDYAGQGPLYDEIRKIAEEHNLTILEDGAPGLCGEYKGKKLCSLGDMAITSFHIAKIFTTVEGGMIFTDDNEHARKSRILRWQGEDPDKKYHHPMLGFNHRMTDLNAAIGLAQTSPGRMQKVLESRKKAAQYYFAKLQGIRHITLPVVAAEYVHAWFLYPILIPKRDEVNAYLLEKDIKANVSWPLPVYEQPPYKQFKGGACPVVEKVSKEVLCLPLFYKITQEEQDYVIEHLLSAIEHCVGVAKEDVVS